MNKMSKHSIENINQLSDDDFISYFSPFFNSRLCNSASGQASKQRPFRSFDDCIDTILDNLMGLMHTPEALEILKDNDRLGIVKGQKRSNMASNEHKGAGLASLESNDQNNLIKLNDEYEKKFGFIFVKAVAGYTKDEIIMAFHDRLQNDMKTEIRIAFHEIAKLARIRSGRLVVNSNM